MARATPQLTSFNAGEFSPNLDGRQDIAKYGNGCKLMQNFIPMVQGPAQRRGGTRHVEATKDSTDRAWLRRFEFSATQAFTIEFGDQYLRFYTLGGQLETGTVTAWSNATAYAVGDLASRLGVNYYCIAAHTNQQPPNATYWYPLTDDIYEIPAPWPLAALTDANGICALTLVQTGDVVYITCPGYVTRKLTRYSNTNWQLSTYQPNTGPFLEQNKVEATQIYASGQTGSVTLEASAAVFASTDVGRLVRLQVEDIKVEPWEAEEAYAAGDLVRFDGKTYKCLANDTSGLTPPIHVQGSAFDGKGAVEWEYQDAGYGIARITGFTDSTTVTATVLTQLPFHVVTSTYPTFRWSLGAWSDTTGYPTTCALWNFRLCLAWGRRYALSVPNDFDDHSADFQGQIRADSAITGILQAADVNDITWLAPAKSLLIGTQGGEFALGSISPSQAFGPANYAVLPQSKRRCSRVQPVIAGESVLYMQRAGRTLLSLDFDIQVDKFRSKNLSVLNTLITKSGVIDMAYQAEPYQALWAVLANGLLVSFTYDQEQDVTAWHRHPLGGGGLAEAVTVIPSADGSRDQVWLIVRRTINGATKRYVEFIETPYEDGDDQEDVFYVDSGLTYDGAATTAISGLEHLEGQTVQVCADGASHPDKVVTAGAITLERSASVVHVGLQCTARLVPNRLEAGSQNGTSQGKTKRIDHVNVRFLDTLGGRIGPYGGTLDEIQFRNASVPMGSPPPPFTGDMRVPYPGDYETEGWIEIRQEQPFPMTVVSLMPALRTYDP